MPSPADAIRPGYPPALLEDIIKPSATPMRRRFGHESLVV